MWMQVSPIMMGVSVMVMMMLSVLHIAPRDHAEHLAWRHISKHHFDHVAFDNQVAGKSLDNP